jgi:multidrug efflux pump subunit AcrB
VVGEETATRQEMGDSRIEAAERGAVRMLAPVMAASLTTMAAFLPIFLVRDQLGDVMVAIPLVVIAVLAASLIECFLILPGHLRHGFGKIKRTRSPFRRYFDDGLAAFRDGPYRRFVELAFEWRYTTVAAAFALLIFSFGLIAGGRVGFHFFPAPEPENIAAYVTFAPGTPRDDRAPALARLEKALLDAEKAANGGGARLVETGFTTIGVSRRNRGDNLAQIEVQLTPSEERSIPTDEVIKAWREAIPAMPGVDKVTIVGRRAGPPGRDIDIQLQNAPVEALKKAALKLRAALTEFPGVSAIDDDLPYGRQELIMEVAPRGAAAGFTAQTVGRQVRDAFDGAIATKFARGEEEITVRVKRIQEMPGIHSLQQIYLRSPEGMRVPLTEVVTIREKEGFSIIQRKDGVRSVSVTADINPQVTNVPDILVRLEQSFLPELANEYGVTYAFKGRTEERLKSFEDLSLGGLLTLVLIYIILAWVFAHYGKPLAVMAIIPFGIVGAILGHMVMGVPLTIISLIGLLGLSGILVNDSIILVSQVVRRRADGEDLETAAIGASQDRLRAVLLTSLTTIGGLLPLIFEESRQAQFLIPMAITLVFGLATATLLVLILVPSLIGIGGDIGKLTQDAKQRLQAFWAAQWPST